MAALFSSTNPQSLNHVPAHERVPEAERRKSLNTEYDKLQKGEITSDEYNSRKAAIDSKATSDKEQSRQKAQAEYESNNSDKKPGTESSAKPEDAKAAETAPASPSGSTKKQKSAASGSTKGSWVKQATLFDGKIDGWAGSSNRQELPFMFEVFNPANSGSPLEYQAILPFNPENYRMVYTPRASVTHTQGGVFEDNIGIAPPKFVIAGVFGVVGTTLLGAAKSLQKEAHTGMYLYHELEKNLLEFYERFGTNKLDATPQDKPVDMKKPLQLRFYNFCDQEYWLVQINQFTLQRNLQRRHLYQYDLQMTGLRRLTESDGKKAKEGDIFIDMKSAQVQRERIADATKAAADMNSWDKFMKDLQGGVSAITGPLQKATAAMGKVMAEVDKLKGMMNQISSAVSDFKNGLTSLVHAPKDLIVTALQTARSITDSAQDIANLPHEFVADMREVQRLLQDYNRNSTMFVAPNTSTTLNMVSSWPARAYSTMFVAPNTSTTTTAPATKEEKAATKKEITTVALPESVKTSTGVLVMDIPEETIFAPGIEAVTNIASKTQTITDQDTIQSVALKNGVDWKQVATLNNIEYPYIVKTDLEALSPTLETVSAAYDIPQGNSMPEIVSAKPGDVVAYDSGKILGVIESVSNNQIHFADTMTTAIATGTEITLHSKKLDVLRPGDRLLIPGTTGTNIEINDSADDVENKLYGTDEYLDSNGHNLIDSNGDIASIAGIANLEMQLGHRITTARGELTALGHPEYGSLVPTFIGKISSPVWFERIMVECQMAVLADPRVQSLSNVKMAVENSKIIFQADVLPINQMGPIQISIPIA